MTRASHTRYIHSIILTPTHKGTRTATGRKRLSSFRRPSLLVAAVAAAYKAMARTLLVASLVACLVAVTYAHGDRTLGTVSGSCKDQFAKIIKDNYATDTKCADAIKKAMSTAPKSDADCPGGVKAGVGSDVQKCMSKSPVSGLQCRQTDMLIFQPAHWLAKLTCCSSTPTEVAGSSDAAETMAAAANSAARTARDLLHGTFRRSACIAEHVAMPSQHWSLLPVCVYAKRAEA